MPVIAYNEFSALLARTAADPWPTVTLIHGEDLLCSKAAEAVLDRLMPAAEQAHGVERIDGAEDGLGRALACLNTYALLSSAKVVVLHDARLFYSDKAKQGLREKMVQAASGGELKKAARPFLNLMALCGLRIEDLATPSLRHKLAEDVDDQAPAWLSPLVDYCRDNGLRIPDARDDAEELRSAMQRGFPAHHRLVMTTDVVDRRKTLYKAIAESGLVVDCSVPRGEARADRLAQEAVMQAALDDAMARAGKQMAVDARRRLFEWTGFDLRTLAGNLEKLISYAGDRRTITDADVTAVLKRTRKDPIFDFTNAVAERDLSAGLFYLQRLIDEGAHPLQLLAALANQIRRLLVARDFIDRDGGRIWNAHMSFAQFRGAPFRAVQQDDETCAAAGEAWEALLDPPAEGATRKSAPTSDLVLARNARSPFPVFQTLKRAAAFDAQALRSAMIDLSDTDRRMKRTGQDPRVLLEAFIIRLCDRRSAPGDRPG